MSKPVPGGRVSRGSSAALSLPGPPHTGLGVGQCPYSLKGRLPPVPWPTLPNAHFSVSCPRGLLSARARLNISGLWACHTTWL